MTKPANSSTGRRVLLNTGAMAGSSLWRILVSFLLQLFVARSLGLEALGQYTVALAYLNVSQIVVELGLQNLLVRDLAQQPRRKKHLFAVSVALQLVASFVVWGLLWGLGPVLPYGAEMQKVLWLVGATLPFYAITISCQIIFQASERMELVMFTEIVVNTLIGLLSLIVLFNQGAIGGLIGVLIITQGLSAILCIVLLQRHKLLLHPAADAEPIIGDNSNAHAASMTPAAPNNIAAVGKLLREAVPFYGLSLADVLLQRLDILLLSLFAGELVTGIYSAAYNVVRILLKLIQSYWKALYPTFSRLGGSQEIQRYNSLAQTSLNYGLLVLLFAAAIATGGSEAILGAIYGADGIDSVGIFQLLVWTGPLFLVELYAITVLMAANRPSISLLIMVIHLLVVCLLLPLLGSQYSAWGAAAAVLAATALGAVASLVALQRTGHPYKLVRVSRMLIPTATTAVAMLLLPAGGFALIGAGILLYLALTWVCGIVTLKDFQMIKAVLYTGKR